MEEALRPEPKRFFMSLRDISFWIRSARTDSIFERLRDDLGSQQKAFDILYTEHPDPFCSTRTYYRYQRLKYERLLSFLPNRPYDDVLDVGCGVGRFTRELAPYASHVLAVDLSAAALEHAGRLSAAHPNIQYKQCDILGIEKVGGAFDLIAVLDVLYYVSPLSDEKLSSVARQLEKLLAPAGLLLLVNHFFFGIDPPSRATRRIHDAFRTASGLQVVSEHKRAFFLATLFSRSGSPEAQASRRPV